MDVEYDPHVLQSLGVEEATERVYVAMIEHPELGVDDLAALLDCSSDAVRSELDRMADLALVSRGDHRQSFLVVPPDQAVEVLIARAHRVMQEQERAIDTARSNLPSLVDVFVRSRARPAQGRIEEIDEPDTVRSRLFQLTQSARVRARFMVPGPAFSPEATAASSRLDHTLMAAGVDLAIITSSESIGACHWRAYLDEISGAGAEVRVHDAPPLLQVLIDDEVAVLPREGDLGAVILHGADAVRASVALFEATWSLSSPLVELDDGPATSLTPRQRQVLILLSAGHTDEMIARRMHCSSRTVGRLVSEVCSAMQAHSRFQAGVLAVERGWLGGGRADACGSTDRPPGPVPPAG